VIVIAARRATAMRAGMCDGLACVTMDAGPHCRRFLFFLNVVATVSDERLGMAVAHQDTLIPRSSGGKWSPRSVTSAGRN